MEKLLTHKLELTENKETLVSPEHLNCTAANSVTTDCWHLVSNWGFQEHSNTFT